MKAIVFLLFAGLLAVQAANFRVVYVPQLIEVDDDFVLEDYDEQLFSLGGIVKNIGNGIHQAGNNIANTANQVGKNIANTANQVGQNIGKTANQVGNTVVNTANQVGQHVGNTANQVGTTVVSTANQVGQNVGSAANQVGQGVVQTVNHIVKDLDKLRRGFEHGFSEAEKNLIRNAKPTIAFLIKAGGFTDAQEAWKHVNWNNLHGLDMAIQLTAKDVGKLYNKLNDMSGGVLNDLAVPVAEKVAMVAFPPAAAIITAGKVTFKVAGQIHDITTLVKGIEGDAKRGDWGGVAIDGFKLFCLVAQDFA